MRMEIAEFLNELRQLRKIEPDPVWKEQTRQRLLARFDAHAQSSVTVTPFRWSEILLPRLIAVPIFTLTAVLFFIVLTQNVGDLSVPLTKVAFVPEPASSVPVNPNLPLATSVERPSAPILLVKNEPQTKKSAPTVRRRRPIARTRLATSIQSIPDARWVFSEAFPGEQSRWVFSQQTQANGS